MNVHTKNDEFRPASAASLGGLGQRFGWLTASKVSLRKLLMFGGVAVVAVGGSALWLTGGRYVSTDNAYIHQPKLVVASDISGLVADVAVHEGQPVKKGDVLFRLDPKPFAIAVDNNKAQLAQTALTLDSMKEDYRRLLSDVAAQEAQVRLAQATFDRSAALIKTGATTAASYDQARFALNAANSQHQSLEAQAKVLLSKLGGNVDAPVTDHPSFLQAKAQLAEVERQLDHTVIRAPFDGIVTQVDALQPGMYLSAATSGMTNGAVAIVGTDSLWIDANFKETDLTFAKVGDGATVTVDAYPGRVWSGRVASIAPASGAEFSILPAQNASGNWVKVVQRIPVRIVLDMTAGGPMLRAGMSVDVSIDTGHKRTLAEIW